MRGGDAGKTAKAQAGRKVRPGDKDQEKRRDKAKSAEDFAEDFGRMAGLRQLEGAAVAHEEDQKLGPS